MERPANFTDEVTEGRSVRAEDERLKQEGWIVNS